MNDALILFRMDHYHYLQELERIWSASVEKHRGGNREPETYLNADERSFIQSIGLTIMDIYDFAEDFADRGEPDFPTFVAIHDIRRSYFFEVQKAKPSEHTLDTATLPAKEDAVAGIPWLPRILPKARAKLRGELSPDIMYCCGGDRRFFKENNIHPAEFLRLVWEKGENDDFIIQWVSERRKSVAVTETA